MNENAQILRALMKGAGLTRQQAADLLHVSLPTVHAWLRPATSKAANPTPLWAVELLALKTRQKIPTAGRRLA